MPIYEYECTDCGHRLEKIQKISDEPLSECPECEKTTLRKLMSASAFRLKGGGWYETDFKKGDKKNLADSKKEKSTSDTSKDAAKKPASTSDSGSKKTTA